MTPPSLKGPWQPGRSGNPAGRPKGSRNKVAASFFDDLHAVWSEQGEAVLRRAAFEKPMEFAAMVAKLMPAKLDITVGTGPLTPEKYDELLAYAEAQLAASMTIEGSAVSLEGGGGSPQAGLIAGEVIEVASSSAPPPEPLFADTTSTVSAPHLNAVSPPSLPDFAAGTHATPSSNQATMLDAGNPTAPDEDDIDPASLF